MQSNTLTLRYNYRIYPTPEQEEKLVRFGAYARGIWNLLLSENQRRYEYDKTFLFYSAMASLLKALKQFEEFAWLKEMDSAAAQQVARDLETSLKNGIRKDRIQRFPKYRLSYQKKKQHNDSFRTVNNSNCIRIEKGTISIPKVGKVPIRYHRKLPSSIKTVTVSYHHGYWEASIPVDVEAKPSKERLESPVGFDINSKHTLVSSNGWYVKNPKYLKQTQEKLKQVQRQLSRRKKGSRRWHNSKQRLLSIHDKIRRQRLDFGHQVSGTIAKSFDLVAFEDLNIKAMQQWNGHMTQDNLMSEITNLTQYKVMREGGLFHKINRFTASTKPCSQCGTLHELSLNDREFECSVCDHKQCRDWNSAINIEQIGINELSQAGTVCRALPTVQHKRSDKTKVRSLLRLDLGSVQSSAA